MSIDTVVYFQVTDPRAAVYEIANYIVARRAADHHHAPQCRRRDEPRADPDQPRLDQRAAARRARRGDRQVGDPGGAGRAEGHRPAAVHPGGDGEADACGPRQARHDPQLRGSARVVDQDRRGPEAGRRADRGGRQAGRDSRRRGRAAVPHPARAGRARCPLPAGAGPGQGDRKGVRRREGRQADAGTACLPIPPDAAADGAG